MTKYIVEHFTVLQGWINTWSVLDGEESTPETFDTEADAQAALREFLEATADADMEYDPVDFRIRPLTSEGKE
jgi:hypothetical protein